MLAAVGFFAFVVAGLGHSVLNLAGATRLRSGLARALEAGGVGIAAVSFLGVVFNVVHVPLRPIAYLALTVVALGASVVRQRRRGPATAAPHDLEETACAAAALGLVVALLVVYCLGASAYPYLEDDDSWKHAEAALFVAKQRTFSVDPSLRALGDFAFYLEPYPPTYDVLMGVLWQLNPSMYTTLKFFNAGLVALALGTSYLLCREYLESPRRGLLAALVLAALPSFMTHFIWSQSLALCVFPVAMYATLKALDDPSWVEVAVMAIGSLLVTQPVVSLMAAVVLVLLVVLVFAREASEAKRVALSTLPQTTRALTVGIGGVALSFVYWGPELAKWGIGGIARLKGAEFTTNWQNDYALRHYTLDETLFPHLTKIDQSTGWGIVVTVALFVGIVAMLLGLSEGWRPRHLLLWFAILFYVVFAPTFGLPSWGSDRTWAYLAIPVALLAASGTFSFAHLLGRHSPLGPAIVFFTAIGVLATSAPAKIEGETGPWPPGQLWPAVRTADGYASPVLDGFVRMRGTLDPNTRVYPFCGSASRAIGFDMDASPWVPEEAHFRERGGRVTLDEAVAFLDAARYSFFTFDSSCEIEWGKPSADGLADGLSNNPRVQPVFTQAGFILARLLPRAGALPQKRETAQRSDRTQQP